MGKQNEADQVAPEQARGLGTVPSFDDLLRDKLEALPPASRRVIRYVSQNRLAFLSTSAAELARRVGASDATVIRAVQALGYRSLADLRGALAATLAEESNPAANLRRTVSDIGAGADEAVAAIIDTHRESLREVDTPESKARIVHAVRVLNPCSRIHIFGIGPSAALAEYVAILLRRHGRDARALTATGAGLADQLLDFRPGDGLLLLAYSRTYAEVRLLFEEADRHDLPVVLVTDSLDARLADRADVAVPARRGRQGRVALHGVTVIVLEAIALGLALAGQEEAITSLARLGELRARLARLG